VFGKDPKEYSKETSILAIGSDGDSGKQLFLILWDHLTGFELVEVVKDPHMVTPFAFERILNPSWIDASLIKGWLSRCDTLHSTKCRTPLAARRLPCSHIPWLVDVQQQCLIRASPND
jgi:hypothetical protein